MSETRQSLYQYILTHKTDGVLPEDFSLPKADSNRINFADGAMDGICIFHMGAADFSQSIPDQAGAALEAAGQRDFANARALLEELTGRHRAVSIIDQLEDYIIEHRETLDLDAVHDFGMELMTGSDNTELVKVGMEILEVFVEPGEEQKERIRTLGLSDEFALFSVFHMQRWTDGNREIFELAKKVRGWGRIHAVERLEPETQEIRDWLLSEGIRNYIMPDYSALTCYQKADVEGRLEGTLSVKECRAIGELLCALLSEGPVAGISAIANGPRVLLSFVEKSKTCLSEAEDYDRIRQIAEYAAADEEREALREACQMILSSRECREAAQNAIRSGEYIDLAASVGIDICKYLLPCLRSDFDRHYMQCHRLLKNADYVEAVLTLFQENLPLSRMASGPADDMGLGEQGKPYRQLIQLIQSLRSLPTGTGEIFIQTAVNAPVVNNRGMALRVMKAWVAREQKPLRQISPSLWQTLDSVYSREVREDLRDSMRALLDDSVEFQQEEL